MWLEAIITQEDFFHLVGRFLPVKIYLHHEDDPSERWLHLGAATQVTLVPEQGLRVTCPAELKWTIAGVHPTVKIDELRVLLRPDVSEKNKGHLLEFNIEIEEAEFHRIPEFIDTPIVKAINAALHRKKPAWNFTKTLTRTVGFGEMFDPVESLQLHASWGKVRITAEALALVVSFKLDFVRND